MSRSEIHTNRNCKFEAHPAFIARRLSARTSARRCVSVKWSGTMTGTSAIPSFRAAAKSASPAIITPSAPTGMGLVYATSWMLATTWATRSSECVREFRSYGMSARIDRSSICVGKFMRLKRE